MPILLISTLALTATLSILLLGGLLLIYFLLRTRLDRIQGSFGDLDRKMELRERAALDRPHADAVPPIDLEPLTASLTASLDGMQGALEALEEHIESVAGDLRRERVVRLREMIERRFHGRGYQSIRILGDLADGIQGATRVTIEGQKGGVTYKGFVTLEEGQIVEEKMTSSHEIFP